MKNYMKYIVAVMLFIAVGYLIYVFIYPIDNKGELYDNTEYIVSEGDSYSFFKKTGDIDNLDFTKFSGTYQLLSFQGDKTVEIQLDLHITNGKFKVVLIDPDNNILDLANKTTTIKTVEGDYRIKMVGDNSSGNIQINVIFVDDNDVK